MFLTDQAMDIILKILLEGSPWGAAVVFMFMYLQERKYSREVTAKALDLAVEISSMKDQLRDVKDTSGRIDKLLLMTEDIRSLVRSK